MTQSLERRAGPPWLPGRRATAECSSSIRVILDEVTDGWNWRQSAGGSPGTPGTPHPAPPTVPLPGPRDAGAAPVAAGRRRRRRARFSPWWSDALARPVARPVRPGRGRGPARPDRRGRARAGDRPGRVAPRRGLGSWCSSPWSPRCWPARSAARSGTRSPSAAAPAAVRPLGGGARPPPAAAQRPPDSLAGVAERLLPSVVTVRVRRHGSQSSAPGSWSPPTAT